jgi:ubiquitin conjugation factor E4 B
MSENEPQISDAEKIRLKRLARLGGPNRAAQTPTPTPSTTDQTESQQPQPGPSASSRLLDSVATSQTSQTPKETPAPKLTTSTIPAARPIKRPSPPSAQPEPAAAPRTRKPTAPSPLPVPYPEWEAQRIQTIFSVTLSVSLK